MESETVSSPRGELSIENQRLLNNYVNRAKQRFTSLEMLENAIGDGRRCPRVVFRNLEGITLPEKARSLWVMMGNTVSDTPSSSVEHEDPKYKGCLITNKDFFKRKGVVDGNNKYFIEYQEKNSQFYVPNAPYALFRMNSDNRKIYCYSNYNIHHINASVKAGFFILNNPSEKIKKLISEIDNVVSSKQILSGRNTGGSSYHAVMKYNGLSADEARYVSGAGSFTITTSPTSNCQLFCVANMNSVIAQSTKLREQIKEIGKAAAKRILLCDVNKVYANTLINVLPKSAIITNTPYKSTNSSDMNLILIKVSEV